VREPAEVKNFQATPDQMYTWDYVLVFKIGEDGRKIKVRNKATGEKYQVEEKEYFQNLTANVLKRLSNAGLKTDLYLSVQADELYCRVAATEERLMKEASRIDYDLQLDTRKCMEAGRARGLRLFNLTNPDGSKVNVDKWEAMFGKYEKFDVSHPEEAFRQELYLRYNPEPDHPRHNSLFNSVDRLRLTYNIIEADEKLDGAEITVSKLIKKKNHPLVAVFPLHEEKAKEELEKKWFVWKSTFKSPLEEIRSYFGEQVAFYFAFLGFYNRSLVIPAIIGLAFFIWQMASGHVDVEGIVPFAVLIASWATLLLEYWKRREAKYRVRWGMTKFLQKEQPRPEFKGEWKPSEVDGKLTEVFPWHKKLIRLILSQTVIWTLICVVIASVVSIFFLREALKDQAWGIIVSAIVNAIQIQILNVIYGIVARLLNAFENHRTDTEFENALIAKTFLFKFINSYNSFFYIAFFKKHDSTVKGCIDGDCLKELQQQLGTIFIALIVVSNIVELGVPWLLKKIAERQNRAVDDSAAPAAAADGVEMGSRNDGANLLAAGLAAPVFKQQSQPEKEFELAPYEGTFDDFDEMVIQFGYVSLFVVAFPITPLLALINNTLETRVDATKLCKLTRRPEPRGAYNIGTWFDILSVVSYIAVVTNALIVCFETQLMEDWTNSDAAVQAYVFILSEHAILLLKFAISYFVPDVPHELDVHVARQEYIVDVLIRGAEEDDDEAQVVNDGGDGEEDEHIEKEDFDWGKVAKSIQYDAGHEFAGVPPATPGGPALV